MDYLNNLLKILENKVFLIPLGIWFAAQGLKILIEVTFYKKKISFRRLIESGGMPSAHSAMVTALATAVGIQDGFDSVIFSVAAIFAIIVMYDAAVVRRETGRQAKVINVVTQKTLTREEREVLKERIGHNFLEVGAGAAFGIILSYLLMYLI